MHAGAAGRALRRHASDHGRRHLEQRHLLTALHAEARRVRALRQRAGRRSLEPADAGPLGLRRSGAGPGATHPGPAAGALLDRAGAQWRAGLSLLARPERGARLLRCGSHPAGGGRGRDRPALLERHQPRHPGRRGARAALCLDGLAARAGRRWCSTTTTGRACGRRGPKPAPCSTAPSARLHRAHHAGRPPAALWPRQPGRRHRPPRRP